MNLRAFESERGPGWERLEVLLRESGGRPERLGPEGVLELGALYRGAAADLAYARRRFPGDPVVARLEGLLVRGARRRLRAGRAAREPVAVPVARLLAAAGGAAR